MNQNILKIEKNYTSIHHETGLSRWKCSFFLFSISIMLYLGVSSTVLRKNRNTDFPINQNICIVNKNQMRYWLLSKVKGHDTLDKSLLRTERRSCSSNFSTECQSLDTEFQLKSSMKRMKSIWCFFRNVKRPYKLFWFHIRRIYRGWLVYLRLWQAVW